MIADCLNYNLRFTRGVEDIGILLTTNEDGDVNELRSVIIRWPEQAVNFAFGGTDLRTLCAHTSVYTLRVKVPGNPHPWYKRRAQ
jgi:hypothetical protein